jgi:hypothetical protein
MTHYSGTSTFQPTILTDFKGRVNGGDMAARRLQWESNAEEREQIRTGTDRDTDQCNTSTLTGLGADGPLRTTK